MSRTLLTIRTRSGGFTFQVSDLEQGPILAPEYGFFVRVVAGPEGGRSPSVPNSSSAAQPPFVQGSSATNAHEFLAELSRRQLKTIRQRTREHAEQNWADAVAAVLGAGPQPSHPRPPFEPVMQIDVPSARLTDQWRLGAWHILRRSAKDSAGRWHFNDFPFGILASETYMILHALDLQGMHREAADGLDQWLSLPVEPRVVPGAGGHHPWALPDRPLGHFSDGKGCLTHAEGLPGVGGHMDGVHGMGPGAIMFSLLEHFRLTGDLDWLKTNAPRMKANAEWILRQRRLLASLVPGGERLWSKGLQPAHVVTPDSERMHMQYYETEAYDWLAVKRLAEALAMIDPAESARLRHEAEAYRVDLLAAIARSILLTPVVPVRDGTYRSFIPFAPYVRGFASGSWGWRRCQGHIGAIYWDTVQSADPLISPADLLSPQDPRVQGHLDVLEDRLLLENTRVNERTQKLRSGTGLVLPRELAVSMRSGAACQHSFAGGRRAELPQVVPQSICRGHHAWRVHLPRAHDRRPAGQDLRGVVLSGAVPQHDGHGRRRYTLAGARDSSGLARARPRIMVRRAPSHFGVVSYEILSDVNSGKITATVDLPSRLAPRTVRLRLRHPKAARLRAVELNAAPWKDFDSERETIQLEGQSGRVVVIAHY